MVDPLPPDPEDRRLMYYFRFCDSFDHLDPDTASLKYGNVEGAYGLTSGPFYGNAARFVGGPNWLDRPPAHQDALGGGVEEFIAADCGLFLQLSPPDSWGTIVGGGPVPALVPVALVTYTGGYSLQQYLEVRRNGSIALRTRTGLLAESEPDVFPFPAFGGVRWVHVEYRVHLKDGSGYAEVYLDGVLALTTGGASGLTDAEWCTHYRIGNIVEPGDPPIGYDNTGLVDVDDFWYAAPDRPPPEFPDYEVDPPGPFGPVGVYRVRLAADGAASDLDATGSHFEQVDDEVADGDDSYVEKPEPPPPPEPPDVPEPDLVGDLYIPGPWWPPPDDLADGYHGLAGWWTGRDPIGAGSSEDELITMRMLYWYPRYDDPEGTAMQVQFRDYNLASEYRTGFLHLDPRPGQLEGLQAGAGIPDLSEPAGTSAPPGTPVPAEGPPAIHRFRLTQLALELVHISPLPLPVGGTKSFAFWFTEVP